MMGNCQKLQVYFKPISDFSTNITSVSSAAPPKKNGSKTQQTSKNKKNPPKTKENGKENMKELHN